MNDTSLVPLEPGRMWASPSFAEPLRRAGWLDFDTAMATHAGNRLRALRDRENWRIELHSAHEAPRVAYLKKHRESARSRWLARLAPREAGVSPGLLEAHNIAALEAAGVPALRLIACGESSRADGRRESFVLTEGLAGYVQLDHDLRARFPLRELADRSDRAELNALLIAVADVARCFHAAGFNHRDFYACHFFVRSTSAGFDVRLIDLQRVERRRWFRWRWIVKDLAQLAYSLPQDRVGPTRQLCFMKRYLGVRRLRSADKRLIRAVLAKRERMIRQLGPHP